LNKAKQEGQKSKLEYQHKEIRIQDKNSSVLTDYNRIAASSRSLAKKNIFKIGADLLSNVKERKTVKSKKGRGLV
jgi:hypothetical protein